LRFCHFHGNLYAMKSTIDAAGRIVVPKALRQALGLKPGQPLEIRAGDGRLEIEIAATRFSTSDSRDWPRKKEIAAPAKPPSAPPQSIP